MSHSEHNASTSNEVNQEEELNDIKKTILRTATDGQLLDHLIVQGRYFHHHHQRQQKQVAQRETAIAEERELLISKKLGLKPVPVVKKHHSVDDMKKLQPKKKQGKSSKKQKIDQSSVNEPSRLMAHVGDARVYSQRRGYTRVCSTWPVDVSKERERVDVEGWDREHGDGLHPLAVYRMSPKSEGGGEVPCWSEEKRKIDVEDPLFPEDPYRSIIYKAWERAVHAASTVIDASPSDSQQQQVPAQSQQETMNDQRRSRAQAEAECKNLHLSLNENACGPSGAAQCPSCHSDRFSTMEQLGDHYYGTEKAEGCSAKLIRDIREKFILRTLENEAKTSVDQMLEIAFLGASEMPEKRVVDCFDIHDFLQDTWSDAVAPNDPPEARPSHLETVQLGNGSPPMVLNQALLDSLHHRITERYSSVPR